MYVCMHLFEYVSADLYTAIGHAINIIYKKYICGDSFTMGDIPLGFAIYRWYALDIERPEWKNISNWYDRLCERSAYQEHIMIPLQ